MRIARTIGVIVALFLVCVLGIPAAAGWIPITVEDDAIGAPAGTLVVAERVSISPEIAQGDIVTAEAGAGELVTRPVRSVDSGVVTLDDASGAALQVGTDRVRAVEVYRIPLVGHLVAGIPAAYRVLVGRILGVLFLAWAATEIWALARREHELGAREIDESTLNSAPRRLELTSAARRIPGTDLVFVPGRPLQSRRSRKRPQPTTARGRLVAVVEELWRALSSLLRSTVRRDPDAPPRGRHRAPDAGSRRRPHRPEPRRSGSHAATAAETVPPTEIRATVVPAHPTRRETRLEARFRPRTAIGPAPADLWSRKPDLADVEHAARVQEFEARRAAAEAAARLDLGPTDPDAEPTAAGEDVPVTGDIAAASVAAPTNESPVDRLLREREAASRRGGSRQD